LTAPLPATAGAPLPPLHTIDCQKFPGTVEVH